MRILITGASGFLGRHLVQYYKSLDWQVICQIRSMSKYKKYENLFQGCQVTIGDLTDQQFVNEIFRKFLVSHVIHAGACKYIDTCEDHPRNTIQTNVLGTLNLLEQCKEYAVAHFVLVSTDKAEQSSSLYGHSKRMAEHLTTTYGYSCYRGVNFWGSDNSFIHKWTNAIKTGGTVTLHDPSHVRYFRLIDDVVEDIYWILTCPVRFDNGIVLPPCVMEVPIVDVYNWLQEHFPQASFVIGKAYYNEKQFEIIPEHIPVLSPSVQYLINNLPSYDICK